MTTRPTRRHKRPTNPVETLPAKILEHLDTLKISFSREQLDRVLREAEEKSWSYLELLEAFLSQPAQSRRERSVERRLREAHFPESYTLEQFDWAFNAAVIDRVQMEELATGDFIRRKDNLLIVGKSGVGKSHLLEGIGRRVCVRGYRVRYVLSEEMLAELGASLADGTTLRRVREYVRPELLIIDGFGFDRIEREQTPQALNLLYKVIDQRSRKCSTALITNIEFEDWNQYLSDGPMVMALLDRLFDRALMLRIDGKSYRAHRARRLPPPGTKKPPKSAPGPRAKQ
jgi:DNA replication protein DnaC